MKAWLASEGGGETFRAQRTLQNDGAPTYASHLSLYKSLVRRERQHSFRSQVGVVALQPRLICGQEHRLVEAGTIGNNLQCKA